MHLERIHAVLQFIADPLGLCRKLLRLSHRHETEAEVIRQSRCEDEAARLNSKDNIRLQWTNLGGQRVDDFAEAGLVFEQRCDVVKEDALLRKIGNLANHLLQVVHINLV